MEDNPEFIDGEAYSHKEEILSFRSIVLQHLKTIGAISCKEMMPGYWTEKSVNMGSYISSQRIYVGDSRLEYLGSINYLHDILLPHFDKQAEGSITKIDSGYSDALLKIDTNIKDFEKKKIELELTYKRKMFQELSRFLYRIRYLEARQFTQ